MIREERKVYMDFLRIVACFWVIFNHGPGYFVYQDSNSPGLSFYYMFFTMVAKINVPIFFMLTGALLLPRNTTYKELFTKRIPRMAIALFLASFIYYIVRHQPTLSLYSIFDFTKKLIIDDHAGAFWYLYAYIGLLLMLPFLQRIAQKFTTADFILLLSVRFITATIIPIANHFLSFWGLPTFWYASSFSIPIMTTQSIFYPLVGYYLDHILDINQLTKKHIFSMAVLSCLGIAISSCITYHEGITSGFTQNYVQTFNYLLAINFFILVKYCFSKHTTLNNYNVLHFISSLTFGIYLMEPILKCIIKESLFDRVIPETFPIFHTFLWCFFSMGVCGLITYYFKKLPAFKKLL